MRKGTVIFCALAVILTLSCSGKEKLNKELLFAVGQGNTGKVKTLLAKGADMYVVEESEKKRTPLLISTGNGDINIVKILIDNGINVNAKGGNGKTALITASERGYIEIAILLISKGANITTRDNSGFSAYMSAILNGHISIVKLLKKKGAVISKNDKEKIESSIRIRKTTEKLIDTGKQKIKKIFEEIVKESSK